MLTIPIFGSDTLSLLAFALSATVTPGGATLLAAASGARFGLRRSLPLLGGISAGLAALVASAGAGLGALLEAAPALQSGMRVVGSAYLVWLACRIARAGAPDLRRAEGRSPMGFRTGVALLWLNPKGWMMALAASATYARLTGPASLAALLGSVFGIAAAVSLLLWCAGGLVLARTLRTAAAWHTVNAALGAALAASVIPIWL
jgi:threonine/homoserine/homoserine lactone efflux protein